jgi:predicted HTH domain antitoxin
MTDIIIQIPDDTIMALKCLPQDIGSEIRMLAAVKLYEMGRLSSGSAARMVGISRVLFLSRLKEYNVPALSLSKEEFIRETHILGINNL